MTKAAPSPKKYLIAAGKVTISVALILAIATKLDFNFFYSQWHKLNPLLVAAFLVLVALQMTVVSGMRLKLLLECLGTKQPFLLTSRVELSGFFFEQIAFGFVGGDAMRLWLLHRVGIPLRQAFKALFVDRCLGFAALLLLVALGLPGLVRFIPDLQDRVPSAAVWAAVFLAAIGVSAALRLLPEKYRRHPVFAEIGGLVSLALRDSFVRYRFLLAFAFATVTHLLNVLIFFLIAHNLGLPVSLDQWFCIVPAALLFSMIPVSAGGWGLREGIFIFGLASLGIRPEEATAVSVLFGLGVLLVTLPGGLLWLWNRGHTR